MEEFKCICGKTFSSLQALRGHKSHCEIHQLDKYGSLKKLEASQAKRRKTLTKTIHETKMPAWKEEKEKLNKIQNEKWILEGHKCECCSKVMTIKYGSGRFCSNHCQHSFLANQNKEEKARKISASLKGKECSHNGLFKRDRIALYNLNPKHCVICGKVIDYDNRDKMTCSAECYAIKRKEIGKKAGLASSAVQVRRSKNEIHFCELCKSFFKDVKHNEPIFNGWDADVIIEDCKYAVLWNGPWHYKEITRKKQNSLKQIQTRDKLKIDNIIKCNYVPYVIIDLGKENKEFVEQEFNKFLNHLRINQIIK